MSTFIVNESQSSSRDSYFLRLNSKPQFHFESNYWYNFTVINGDFVLQDGGNVEPLKCIKCLYITYHKGTEDFYKVHPK